MLLQVKKNTVEDLRGEYFCDLVSDDLFHRCIPYPERLELQVQPPPLPPFNL